MFDFIRMVENKLANSCSNLFSTKFFELHSITGRQAFAVDDCLADILSISILAIESTVFAVKIFKKKTLKFLPKKFS